MITATNSSLVVAFAVVVLLFVFFAGGALMEGMSNGGMEGGGWMGVSTWMWTPTLLSLGLGVVLVRVIYKKGLLQTDWEKADTRGLNQTFSRPLHARTDADRIAQSKFKRVTPSVLGTPEPSSN